MEKWMDRYADNARRLWKTTECCRRVEEYGKASSITYPDGWEYWCAVWRGLEHRKLDKQMSVDVGKGYRSQISQKM